MDYVVSCGRCVFLLNGYRSVSVALCRAFHCCFDGFIFGMNIPFRDGNVTVSGEVGQGEWVHFRCPSRKAGVAQTIKLERLDAGHAEDSFLLFPHTGAFHMPASCRGRKYPTVLTLSD